MSRTTQRKMYLIAGIVVLLIVGAMLAVGWWQRRSGAALCARRAVPLSGGELLLQDQREQRTRRWVRVGLDGRIRGEASIEGSPIAWDTQRLWTLSSGRLSLYALPSLAQASGPGAAVAQHTALARGLVPIGLTRRGELVVRGSDQAYYAIEPGGTIKRLDEDLRSVRSQRAAGIRALPSDPSGPAGHAIGTDEPMSLTSQAGSSGYRDGNPSAEDPVTLDPSSLSLIAPRILVDDARGDALSLGAPPSFVVLSDDRAGAAPSHRVSRVGPDGAVAWTQDASKLLGPSGIPRASYRVLFAGIRSGDLVLLVTALRVTRYEAGRQEDCDARIVVVDPADGQVRSRREIAGP